MVLHPRTGRRRTDGQTDRASGDLQHAQEILVVLDPRRVLHARVRVRERILSALRTPQASDPPFSLGDRGANLPLGFHSLLGHAQNGDVTDGAKLVAVAAAR